MMWLACMLFLTAGALQAACGQALALGLDVSGSVDPVEYQMQREGLAAALTSQSVRQVLLAQGRAPTDIAVFEWSGPTHQALVQPWTTVTDSQNLNALASNLRTTARVQGSLTTAIGSAMLFGVGLLDQRSDCWKRTLDISGDGPANTGPRPQDLPADAIPPDIIINALVIGNADLFGRDERSVDIKELSSYFNAYVIRGPNAFVEVALGFEDYAAAMERKLLRELQSLALSGTVESPPVTDVLQEMHLPRTRPVWITQP